MVSLNFGPRALKDFELLKNLRSGRSIMVRINRQQAEKIKYLIMMDHEAIYIELDENETVADDNSGISQKCMHQETI